MCTEKDHGRREALRKSVAGGAGGAVALFRHIDDHVDIHFNNNYYSVVQSETDLRRGLGVVYGLNISA